MRPLWPLLLSALGATAAAAQSAPPGAWSCTGCHGLGTEAPYPIDHLGTDEIAAALAAFSSGERPATVMNRIAAGFDAAEAEAIAKWFADPERDR